MNDVNSNISKSEINHHIDIFHLSTEGFIEELLHVIEKNPKAVNKLNEDGWTPLFTAALNGHRDVVELLLNKNADVNATDSDLRTPLHIACFKGHKKICRLLVAHGGNLCTADKWGRTPLHWAASQGHLKVAHELVMHEADIHTRDQWGLNPLHWALVNDHTDVAEYLVSKGATTSGVVYDTLRAAPENDRTLKLNLEQQLMESSDWNKDNLCAVKMQALEENLAQADLLIKNLAAALEANVDVDRALMGKMRLFFELELERRLSEAEHRRLVAEASAQNANALLSNWEAQVADRDRDIAVLIEENNGLTDKVESLQSQLSTLAEQLSNSEGNLQEALGMLEAMEKEFTTALGQVDNLTEELSQAKANGHWELGESETAIKRLVEEKIKFDAEIGALTAEFETKLSDLESRLNSEKDYLRQTFKAELALEQEQWMKQQQDVQAENSLLMGTIDELSSELERKLSVVLALEHQLQQEKGQLEGVDDRLTYMTVQIEHSQETITDLRRRLLESEGDLSLARTQLTEAHVRSEEQQEQSERLGSELTTLVMALQAQLSDTERRLLESTSLMQNSDHAQTAQDSTIRQLQAQLQETQSQLHEARLRMASLDISYKELQAANVELETISCENSAYATKYHELQSQLEERIAHAKSSSEKVVGLERQLNAQDRKFSSEREDLERGLATLRERLSVSEKKAGEYEALHADLKGLFEERSRKLAEAQARLSEYDRLHELVTQLQRKVTEQDGQIAFLENKAADSETELCESNAQLSKTRARLSDCSGRVSFLEEERSRLGDSLVSTKARLLESEKKLLETETLLRTMQVDSDKSYSLMTELNGKTADLLSQRHILERQLSDVRVELGESLAANQDLSKRLAEIEVQREWLEEQLLANQALVSEYEKRTMGLEERHGALEGVLASTTQLLTDCQIRLTNIEMQGIHGICPLQSLENLEALKQLRRDISNVEENLATSKGVLLAAKGFYMGSSETVLSVEATELLSRVQAVEGVMETTNKLVSDCQKRQMELESELSDRQNRLSDSENEIMALRDRVLELEREVSEGLVALSSQECQQLEKDCRLSEAEMKTLQAYARAETAERLLSENEFQIIELEAKCNNFANRLTEALDALTVAKSETKVVQDRDEELRALHAETERKVGLNKEQLTSTTIRLVHVETQLQESEAKLRESESSLKSAEELLHAARRQVIDALHQKSDMANQLTLTKARLAEAESRVMSLEANVVATSEQLSGLRETLDDGKQMQEECQPVDSETQLLSVLNQVRARVSELEGQLAESETDKKDMSRNLIDAYNSINSLRQTNIDNLKRLTETESKVLGGKSSFAAEKKRVEELEEVVRETASMLQLERRLRQELETAAAELETKLAEAEMGESGGTALWPDKRVLELEELSRDQARRLLEAEDKLGRMESQKLDLQTRLSSSACILLDAESRLTEVQVALCEYESQMAAASRQLLEAESRRVRLLAVVGGQRQSQTDVAMNEVDIQEGNIVGTANLLTDSVCRIQQLELMTSATQSRLTKIRDDLCMQDSS